MPGFKRLLSGLLWFTLGVIVGWAILPQPIRQADPRPPMQAEATSTVSVLVDYDDGRIITYPEVPVESGATVWSVMERLSSARGLAVEAQDYGGDLGRLVTAIGGLHSGQSRDRYWFFWVNQRFAEVGVSQYRLSPGDHVMWKYTSNAFKAETK